MLALSPSIQLYGYTISHINFRHKKIFRKKMISIFRFLVFMLICSSGMQCAVDDQTRFFGYYEERDLELFKSNNNRNLGLIEQFAEHKTVSGRLCFKALLSNPSTSVDVIHKRQAAIKSLLVDDKQMTDLNQILEKIAQFEQALLPSSASHDPIAEKIINNFYFSSSSFKDYNNSPIALQLKHSAKVLGIFGPVAEHLIFHFALEHLWGDKEPAKAHAHAHNHDHGQCHGHHQHAGCIHHMKVADDAAWYKKAGLTALKVGHFAVHAWSVKEMIEHIGAEIEVVNQLYKKIAEVKCLVQALQGLNQLIAKNRDLGLACDHHNALTTLFSADAAPEIKELLAVLDQDFTMDGSCSWYSYIGRTLHAYSAVQKSLILLAPALALLGQVDALAGVAHVVKKQNSENAQFCFVEFTKDSAKPYMNMQGFWNVMLDSHEVIKNNVELGGGKCSKIIITGPNRAGKSSTIKALALNVILAQVFGIAAADKATMSIFDRLFTYITVTDDITQNRSMLVAEILRAEECIKMLTSLKDGKHAFVIIDDSLFKGTTFEKGQEAAYNFVQNLGLSEKVLACVATHLPRLTTLEKAFPRMFENYQIAITKKFKGLAQSTFTLKKGISSPNQVFDLIQA